MRKWGGLLVAVVIASLMVLLLLLWLSTAAFGWLKLAGVVSS